ncbi:AP2 domain-containing protein [Bacillus oleivorans]|uniref:AP2 domain-containing protein n=1 Tax=Bacillus oleivorans TaxID=1448271 RepID=A0A285CJM7_9BACI|nr:AP2 domain-containing protein [Bacillus oleivorans]SNX67801.1 AP2 domain-containing protein [Bacillus oleivorans]
MKNDYEIRGETTVIFVSHKGKALEVLVDTEDLPKLQEIPYKWCVRYKPQTNTYYAMANYYEKRKYIQLHRFLTNAEDGLVVDHINHNTLDNRKKNLRVITNGQNLQNRRGATSLSSSGIRGVSWRKDINKWRARVNVNGKEYNVGVFDKQEDAEKAVVNARKKLMPYATA